jgi:hypothetical protein
MLSSTTHKNVPSSHSRLLGTLPTPRSSMATRHHPLRLPPRRPLYIAHLNPPSIRRRSGRRHLASKRLCRPTLPSRHRGTAVVPTSHSSLLRSVLSLTGLLPTRPSYFSTFSRHGTMRLTTLPTFYTISYFFAHTHQDKNDLSAALLYVCKTRI